MRKFITIVGLAWFCGAATVSKAALVIYSYTGITASHDSAISAWFQFDSSAMSDNLVFFYEIPQHGFHISGDNIPLNGEYDRFLGGGIEFHSTVPGPQNLPSFQSLVIQNSQSLYFVQSDALGDPDTFLGGPDGTGTVYSGAWSFGPIPLTISCPAALAVAAGPDCLATNVDLGSPVITSNFDVTSVTNDAPLMFPLGTNLVTWTVTDVVGNRDSCVQRVIVQDTTPPQILRITAVPNTLWPPNRRMVQVNLNVDSVDNCDPSPVAHIIQVRSSDPERTFEPDWEITGPLSVNLRAKRLGGVKGRTYTIVVECQDFSGNVSSASVFVSVPHDRRADSRPLTR